MCPLVFKLALYLPACLSACLPHLQEQAAEHANEASRARDAQLLLRKAAAGGYGGGSGPLRDAAGRPITDLNQARLPAASISILCLMPAELEELL